MSKLEQKIDELQIKLDPLKTTPQLIEFNKETKKKLEKVDHDTQKKKQFHRDTDDLKIIRFMHGSMQVRMWKIWF